MRVRHCWMCESRLPTRCETTRVTGEGMGAPLFGYTRPYGAVPGGQAEYPRRVPQARYGPVKKKRDGAVKVLMKPWTPPRPGHGSPASPPFRPVTAP